MMRILRFMGAGSVGVLLYYLMLFVLTEVAGVWYLASATAASVVNYGSNFALQKFWAFENRDLKQIHWQVGVYAALTVSLFTANLLFLYLLVEYIHLWYLAAQVIVTAVLTVISYVVSQRIFSQK